jgi:signal transduction histidine kinase
MIQTTSTGLAHRPAIDDNGRAPLVEEIPYYGIDELRSDGSFVRRVRDLLDDLRAGTGMEATLRISFIWPSSIPVSVAENLGAIVEEALENIRRHGAATKVEIQLGADVESVFLVLRDNARRSPWSRRISEQDEALWAIQAKAVRLAAHVEVVESEGKGSKLRVVLPPW